jgi:hypothetical protein
MWGSSAAAAEQQQRLSQIKWYGSVAGFYNDPLAAHKRKWRKQLCCSGGDVGSNATGAAAAGRLDAEMWEQEQLWQQQWRRPQREAVVHYNDVAQ